MANSLPGSPIVGYYNEEKKDFEEHNRIIDISNGKFEIKDTTKPYGFIDLNAKVWFATYLDDGVEHEYLCTEGWLWTSQYPECARVLQGAGNNQSMELDEMSLKGEWTTDENNLPEFFIINEAIISKLCILGDDVEPCFEGASVTAPQIQFTFEDGFKEQLFSMMKELKNLQQKGGTKVFSRYSVTIGDTLWNALYSYIEKTYPSNSDEFNSMYRIDSICEEDNQKFAVLQHRTDNKYYKLAFEFNVDEEFVPTDTLIEVTSSYTAQIENLDPQFSAEEVANFEANYSDKTDKEESSDFEDKSESKESENEEGSTEEKEEDNEGEESSTQTYSLEEIPEYIALQTQYNELNTQYSDLQESYNTLKTEIDSLRAYKATNEREKKQEMINSFYMLSEEDTKDVVENIDKYSLDEIEAKLSVICVRNKVSFDLDDNKGEKPPTTFNLESGEDESMPAWVKRAMSVAKTLE